MRTTILLLLITLLPACASNRPANLPGGARLVAESPAPLAFTAEEKGTLYLRDHAANQVLFATPLTPRQRVDIDPKSNRITVNNPPLPGGPALSPTAAYELYFKPATQREYHPSYNP
jgi:hypothetical protein